MKNTAQTPSTQAEATAERFALRVVGLNPHAARYAVETIAVFAIRKEAERDHAPETVDAVDGDCADRVIQLEFILDKRD